MKAGSLYRHYKGTVYQFLGLAKLESDLTTVVLYRQFDTPTGQVWVRPLTEWSQVVTHNGQQVNRFSIYQ